jgi:serine/threonine protein kinase
VLKIADFGLARSILGGLSRANNEPGSPEYTNMVVTRWYRPPELFLRFRKYGTSIDIWGVGCILGEMLTKRPILQGNTDQEQLQKIWELCGLPTKDNFPEWDEHGGCPDDGCEHPEKSRGQLMVPPLHIQSHLQWRRHVRDDFLKCVLAPSVPTRILRACASDGRKLIFAPRTPASRRLGSASYADLIDRCLTLDPAKRPTALECLEHEYFQTLPAPAKLGSCVLLLRAHPSLSRYTPRGSPVDRLPNPGVVAPGSRSTAPRTRLAGRTTEPALPRACSTKASRSRPSTPIGRAPPRSTPPAKRATRLLTAGAPAPPGVWLQGRLRSSRRRRRSTPTCRSRRSMPRRRNRSRTAHSSRRRR